MRCADARSVQIGVVFSATELRVRMRNDGRRLAAPERASDLVAAGPYGLMGIQERAERIGARPAIRSSPGAGALLEPRLPL